MGIQWKNSDEKPPMNTFLLKTDFFNVSYQIRAIQMIGEILKYAGQIQLIKNA